MTNTPPQSPRTPSELKFTPQPMVGWFNPRQLLSTGVQALLSEVIGSYADKRELQAALRGNPGPHTDYANSDEIWVDFVADLGDGFDSTYSVASLLAQPTLTVDGTEDTPRGRVLIMGGDQVYPVARRNEYQNRLHGPYEAALPYVPDERPHLFAIPGNHDWYDGLTSFLRVFCQQRGIGAWQTRQSRSYFALLLPHRWWILGTDMQLETDIDQPQLEFFTSVCRDHMKPGDRVILCTAAPTWVDVENGNKEAYENLSFFEQRVIEQNKARLVVTLTGDLHHYARYQSTDPNEPRQKITAGGGGAFLAGTHDLPKTLTLPRGEVEEHYDRTMIYPTEKTSRRLALGAVGFLLRNGWFAALLGALYLFYAWLIQSASQRAGAGSFLSDVADKPLGQWRAVLGSFWTILVHNPGVVAMLSLVVAGLALFSVPERPGWWRAVVARVAGALHGVSHILLTVALVWWFATLDHAYLTPALGASIPATVRTAIESTLFSAAMLVIGSVAGGMLMGAYLILANQLLGLHRSDVFASQSIRDYKNFLRLHVGPDGTLTIRAYGVDRVCRKWRFNANAPPGQPWMVPDDGQRLTARLIDRITIR
jgi:hypothetical protein